MVSGAIIEREFKLDIMALLDPYYIFKATYKLEYAKVMNCYVSPLGGATKSLRTLAIGPPVDMLLVQSQVDI